MEHDVVVVGAGPNGLAAAVELARAGLDVLVRERADEAGGGARTAELTLPGYHHDVCSAVHPMAAASPFFASLPLGDHGLEWIHPPAPLAHPLEGGRAVLLQRDPGRTARGLGPGGGSWHELVDPFLPGWEDLIPTLLGPLDVPSRPVLTARFGLRAIRSATALADGILDGPEARALFAGIAAHSVLPLERAPSAAVGLVLALAAHAVGWPVPRGGSGRITKALVSILESLGGRVETGRTVRSLDELPAARATVLDVTPAQLLEIGGDRLPRGYRRSLKRYRYGPGVFKVDWALSGPIPWSAPACAEAGTVHLGGLREEVAAAEKAPWEGRVAQRPFVILAQPSLFDGGRAPEGRHTAWAYCHVPNGWTGNALDAIEGQVERFAPGFRELILARSVRGPVELESDNPNLVGGDIGGGIQDLGQLFFRPVAALRPYRTPARGLYLCSSSTPPGGGVHGMCGYHAARTVLGDLFT